MLCPNFLGLIRIILNTLDPHFHEVYLLRVFLQCYKVSEHLQGACCSRTWQPKWNCTCNNKLNNRLYHNLNWGDKFYIINLFRKINLKPNHLGSRTTRWGGWLVFVFFGMGSPGSYRQIHGIASLSPLGTWCGWQHFFHSHVPEPSFSKLHRSTCHDMTKFEPMTLCYMGRALSIQLYILIRRILFSFIISL